MQIKNKTLFIEQNRLTKFNVPQLWQELNTLPLQEIFQINLSKVKIIDSAGVAFLDEVMKKFELFSPQIIGASTEIQKAIQIFSSLNLQMSKPPLPENFFVKIGGNFYKMLTRWGEGLILTADIAFWSFWGIFDRKGQRKGAVIKQSLLIGVDALGIVALLSLIIGLILALQSAAQLRQYGASIFVADLIAISMVREMGPIMTAIMIAGRSGSAIASEIATMTVTEEIDALKMMAINPVRYVVVPKFHAITICMPLLVTLSTIIGIFGGLIIAMTYLDLSAVSYFTETFKILTLKDVLVGLSKSVAFAWVIVIIGSYYGFNVKGGAEGVGKATTLSVVASIFGIIVLDVIFSFMYLGK